MKDANGVEIPVEEAAKFLDEVRLERERQKEKYSIEHDAEWGMAHLKWMCQYYIYIDEKVKAAAMVEAINDLHAHLLSQEKQPL